MGAIGGEARLRLVVVSTDIKSWDWKEVSTRKLVRSAVWLGLRAEVEATGAGESMASSFSLILGTSILPLYFVPVVACA